MRHVISLILLASLSTALEARRFANVEHKYSFDAPAGWSLANPNFMITSHSGASLVESLIPIQARPSLRQISKTAGMIAAIGADYETSHEQFPIKGKNWSGLISVFVEPRRAGREQRHVLQMVTRHQGHYRLFYLAIPSQEWTLSRGSFLTILSGLEFSQDGK